jgi:hypothetical protein
VAHERVICTPHLGASTEEAQEKVAVEVAEQILAYLTRGEISNAVNLPRVPVEHQARLQPYVDLAGRIGGLIGQLRSGIEEVEIALAGDIAEVGQKLVSGAALAGLLRPHLDLPVNEVNAPLLAQERGLAVKESVVLREANFTSSVTMRVGGAGGALEVKGTVFATANGPAPRIVAIEDRGRFFVEVVPEGHHLVLRNEDRPGVIGAVGTILGSRGINVSRMQVGLDAASREALQLWNLDATVGAEALAAILAVPGVKTATVVHL